MMLAGLLATLFLLPYVLGTLYPSVFWATHSALFVSTTTAVTLGALALVSAGTTLFSPRLRNYVASLSRQRPYAAILILAAAYTAYLLQPPLPVDPWGDAPQFTHAFAGQDNAEVSEEQHLELLLSLNVFNAKVGERTVLNAIALLPFPFRTGFLILGALCGGAFILCWLLYIRRLGLDPTRKLLLNLLGLSAPWLLWFTGHIEVYAPVLLINACIGMAAERALTQRNLRWRWLLLLLLPIALKLHITSWLLLPAVIMPWIQAYKPGTLTWRYVSIGLFLPVMVAGVYIYTDVMGAHTGSRAGHILLINRAWLRMIPEAAPLDGYWLFAPRHLSDMLNAVLLWSPGALLLLCGAITRREINTDDPVTVVLGSTLLIQLCFFFMLNPLLGMELDSDLMSLPGPFLLVFTAAVASRTDRWTLAPKLAGTVIALMILTLPAFLVNRDADALSQRIQQIAYGSFTGYWIRSAGTLDLSMAVGKVAPEERKRRYELAVEQWKPHANPTNDKEYAQVIWRVAQIYRNGIQDTATALRYHREASLYAPNYGPNVLGHVDAAYREGAISEAYDKAKLLVRLAYPSPQKAGLMAIHMAIAASDKPTTQRFCNEYLRVWPKDDFITRLQRDLNAGKELKDLLTYFALPEKARPKIE